MFVDEVAEMIVKILAEKLIENFSKYWIILSWSSFSSVLSYSQMYWWRRLLSLNWKNDLQNAFSSSFVLCLNDWLINN
jgi:hypothetical protein